MKQSKHFAQKEKAERPKRSVVWYVVVFLLLGVMGFSAFKVISALVNYHNEDQAYEDIAESAVSQAEQKTVRKISRAKTNDVSSSASSESPPAQPESSGEESSEEPVEEEVIEIVDLYIDYETLFQTNSDVAGWIYCEGTAINYPIVHGSDNSYYLNHRFDSVYSSFGSIFMDYRCPKDFSASNTLIYGHHMDNGSMFAAIVKYKNQSFYNAHPYMQIYTPSGDYLLELFAGYTAATDDLCYTSSIYGGDMDALIDHALALSTFQSGIRPSASDRIVTLSTCAYDFKNARYVVLGILTPLL